MGSSPRERWPRELVIVSKSTPKLQFSKHERERKHAARRHPLQVWARGPGWERQEAERTAVRELCSLAERRVRFLHMAGARRRPFDARPCRRRHRGSGASYAQPAAACSPQGSAVARSSLTTGPSRQSRSSCMRAGFPGGASGAGSGGWVAGDGQPCAAACPGAAASCLRCPVPASRRAAAASRSHRSSQSAAALCAPPILGAGSGSPGQHAALHFSCGARQRRRQLLLAAFRAGHGDHRPLQ